MHRLSDSTSARFRRLDRRLHIDHRGRSEWVWAIPLLTASVALALFVAAGISSGIGPAVYIPVAIIVALVMGGLSVSYMTPEDDSPGDDWRGRRRRREPSTPPAPSPFGWSVWTPSPPDPGGRLTPGPDPRRRDEAPRPGETRPVPGADRRG